MTLGRQERFRVEWYVPDRLSQPSRRRQILAIDDQVDAAGVSGPQTHAGLIGNRILIAGLQHPGYDRLMILRQLNPACSRCRDDDPGRWHRIWRRGRGRCRRRSDG